MSTILSNIRLKLTSFHCSNSWFKGTHVSVLSLSLSFLACILPFPSHACSNLYHSLPEGVVGTNTARAPFFARCIRTWMVQRRFFIPSCRISRDTTEEYCFLSCCTGTRNYSDVYFNFFFIFKHAGYLPSRIKNHRDNHFTFGIYYTSFSLNEVKSTATCSFEIRIRNWS